MKGKVLKFAKESGKTQLEYDSRYISILIFIENKEQRSADRLYGSDISIQYAFRFQRVGKREREGVSMNGEKGNQSHLHRIVLD